MSLFVLLSLFLEAKLPFKCEAYLVYYSFIYYKVSIQSNRLEDMPAGCVVRH